MPTWAIILLIAVAVIVLFLIFTYNGLVRLRNMVDEAWNQISVQLKRRHDLIPNLVNAVKGYMDFEQETLTKVIEARSAAVTATERGPGNAAQAAQRGNVLGPQLARGLVVLGGGSEVPERRLEQAPRLEMQASGAPRLGVLGELLLTHAQQRTSHAGTRL